MEKVSVIVPVYNGEKCIKRCADSILSQDYPELELILIDPERDLFSLSMIE